MRAPQIVLRIEKDLGGERPAVFVPEVDHQADATLSVEDELRRTEEELRVAERELRAMQADVQQSEVGLLRAQAEIKLAEVELLRAKAELIEKKRAAAGMANRASSHASGFDEQSSEEIPVD